MQSLINCKPSSYFDVLHAPNDECRLQSQRVRVVAQRLHEIFRKEFALAHGARGGSYWIFVARSSSPYRNLMICCSAHCD